MVIILLGAAGVFAAAISIGAHERFEGWARRFELWRLIDESVVLFVLLAFGLGIFAWRRWRELRAEIAYRKDLERRLKHQATHDPLTGLPGRTFLMDRIEHALARTRRGTAPPAVLFLDLDGFKRVNDSFGHDVGDHLLVLLAKRLRGLVRPADTVTRLGGDEFVVLLEEIEDASEAIEVAERIRRALQLPLTSEPRAISVRTSIGIALATPGEDTPESILRNADAAMYWAKKRRKWYHIVPEPGPKGRTKT